MATKSGVSKLLKRSAAWITAVVLICSMLTSCSGEAKITYDDNNSVSSAKDSVVENGGQSVPESNVQSVPENNVQSVPENNVQSVPENNVQSTPENNGFGVIEPPSSVSVSGETGFTINGDKADLTNAVYGRNEEYTSLLFEGTYSDCNVLLVAATLGSFDNSATYVQDDFGDKIEVLICIIDPNSGEFLVGSSSSQGISDARITTGEDLTVSVSGKLIDETLGEIAFSVNSEVTATSMDEISAIIRDYDAQTVTQNPGNGGGNQPMNCVGCSKRERGKCPDCNGDRSCHICVDGMDHCISCGGSRICQKCGGSGDCPYCGGNGIMYN